MDLSTTFQFAAAASNVVLTVVFVIGYYIVVIKQNRQMLQQNQQVLSEMRSTSRAARGHLQIIVEPTTPTCPRSTWLFATSAGALLRP